jgi:hypothetical protein
VTWQKRNHGGTVTPVDAMLYFNEDSQPLQTCVVYAVTTGCYDCIVCTLVPSNYRYNNEHAVIDTTTLLVESRASTQRGMFTVRIPAEPLSKTRSRDSVIGIATGWTTEGSEFVSRYGQEFSLLRVVQTYFGVHPTSYPMGTGGSFPGDKAAGA